MLKVNVTLVTVSSIRGYGIYEKLICDVCGTENGGMLS
jgi:hypothetical protein